MGMGLIEEHAREINGFSPDWEMYAWECLPHRAPTVTYKLTGAVVPRITKGPRKGQRNWRQEDKSTRRTVYITPEQHKIWLAAWERKAGKCCECQGEGEVVHTISVNKPTTYRQCGRCGGTGVPPTTEAAP